MVHSIPLLTNKSEWGFVCGRISVLEGRLLTRDFLLSIATLHHRDDIFQHLQDTYLRDYIAPSSPWEDFSLLADRFFYDLAISIRDESPSPIPANLFLAQGDYLNLKNALSGMDNYPFSPGEVSIEKIMAIAKGDFSDLPPVFKEIAIGNWNEIQESGRTFADMIVDGAYLRHLISLAHEAESPMIGSCTEHRVLTYMVLVLWRALRQNRQLKDYRHYFLPIGEFNAIFYELSGVNTIDAWPPIVGGEVGDALAQALQTENTDPVSRFELLSINLHTKLAQDGLMQTAGPERVYSFLSRLSGEIQNLKLVVCGKLNNIDPTLLVDCIREIYG